MTNRSRTLAFSAALLFLVPLRGLAQPAPSAQPAPTAKSDRWLHIRVESPSPRGEMVRVNVPIELAEKVLPAIKHERLRDGKVRINSSDLNGVDLRALLDAVRTSRDGEFVTVQSNENDVRVAKQGGHLLVHVYEKHAGKKAQVEIRVPMRVVDALLSAGKDELDILAALHALSAQGDTDLVSVKDSENTVHIWLDSKNSAE
jgi:hypothetical protein